MKSEDKNVSKKLNLVAAGCAVSLAMTAGQAFAEGSNWTYDLSFNLWLNDTTLNADTPFGEVSGTLSFSDALKSLDFAFMGTAEARNGPWGIIGDVLYYKLTGSGDTPDAVLFSGASMESKITVATGYLAYRVHEDATTALDLGVGLRAFSSSIDTTLQGPPAQNQTFSRSDEWIDPIVAARLRVAFNEKWFGTMMLDFGGNGGGYNQTWQVLATAGYRINDNWMLQGGYRYLEASQETGNGRTSMAFSGPILGVTYHF